MAVENWQRVMLVGEKELTVLCIGLRGLADAMYTHHVRQPRQVNKERASVQPIVMASGFVMNLCKFQVVVSCVVYILMTLLFAVAFLSLTFCIMSTVWIAAVCGIGRQRWSRRKMWIAALLKNNTGYLWFCPGWLSWFRIFICIDHDASRHKV